MVKWKSALENLVTSLSFWKDKTVLITGHTGFKGSWLALWLQKLQAKVIGYSLPPPTTPNLFTVANVGEAMVHINADIGDFERLRQTIAEYQPEIVFHMAAQSLVRYSYHNPIETYKTNIMGTVNLFEAIRQVGHVKAIINVTSDKCYENQEWTWGYRENDPLGGYDPYSNSKACSELVTKAFRNSYFNEKGIGIASVRAGNVIGGGDWAMDRLIPDIVKGIIDNQEITIRYPNALRPWQHVLDPLFGYLLLAERLYADPNRYGDAWNFGPSLQDIKPVSYIVEQVLSIWNKNSSWINNGDKNLHETSCLMLDNTKARVQLNWKPRWNLNEALEKTITWYQAFNEGKNIQNQTFDQIKDYLNRN